MCTRLWKDAKKKKDAKDAKNAISHRGRALAQLREWLLANSEAFEAECRAAAS